MSSQEPLVFDAVHSKSASYGLHQGLQNTYKYGEGILCKHRDLLSNNRSKIKIDVTYPRAIIKAENLYEMAVRKRLDERKRAWSLYGFKEGLLLELPPK